MRRLLRQITSISSPFHEPAGFEASVEVSGHEGWVSDIPDVVAILNRAIWKFSFTLLDGKFDWKFQFNRVPAST